MANKLLETIYQSMSVGEPLPRVDETKTLPSHYSNVANSFRNPNLITDPTALGFRLFFHFGDNQGLLASPDFVNSAEAYLARTGQTYRRDVLKQFKQHLSNVNSTFHFLFQSIDGFEPMIERRPGQRVDDEARLIINCLETIDWKIQAINELYQSIVNDHQRGVEVLPENLRRFSMSIYVYDQIILDEYIGLNDSKVNASVIAPTHSTVNNIPTNKHIMFDLSGCEFDPYQSGKNFFGGATNAETTETKNTIAIKYMNFARSNLFLHIVGENEVSDKSLDFAKAATSRKVEDQSKFKQIFNTLASPFYKAVEDVRKVMPTGVGATVEAVNVFAGELAQFAAAQAANAINARIQRLFLGNVYELDPADLYQLAQSETFLEQFSTIQNGIRNARQGRRDPAHDIKSEPKPPRNVYNP